MRRLLVALALVTASTTAALAGPYLGLAVGPSPGVDSSVSPMSNGAGRSARFLAGYRFPKLPFVGALSVEGSITASQMQLLRFGETEWSGREATLWGKY